MPISQDSFTSANTFPTKLLMVDVINAENKIKPYHIQLYPTNKCNLDCSFCSCANKDIDHSLPFAKIKEALVQAKNCGAKAVTITGGGEPLLHPEINKIIRFITDSDMKVGITTNGVSIDTLNQRSLDAITWIRISYSDDRTFDPTILKPIVRANPNIDWSFSYTATVPFNHHLFRELVTFAIAQDFTHVRLVSNILDLDNAVDFAEVKTYLVTNHINDSIVIYQDRKNYTVGASKCWISLLKPVINADGFMYPCCGTQYRKMVPSLSCSEEDAMGLSTDVINKHTEQAYFDGSACERCYYSDYNIVLDKLLNKEQIDVVLPTEVKHVDFV